MTVVRGKLKALPPAKCVHAAIFDYFVFVELVQTPFMHLNEVINCLKIVKKRQLQKKIQK